MLESKIEKDSVIAAEKLGWWSVKLLSTLHKGIHDRMFIGHGKLVLIEYKQPGKKLSRMQEKVHKDFSDSGVKTYVSRSVKETIDILESVRNE
jgi:hypothetical protein